MLTIISRQGEENPSVGYQVQPPHFWEVGAFLVYPSCYTRQEVDTERAEVTAQGQRVSQMQSWEWSPLSRFPVFSFPQQVIMPFRWIIS